MDIRRYGYPLQGSDSNGSDPEGAEKRSLWKFSKNH